MMDAEFLRQQPVFGGVGERAMAAILPLLREHRFAAGDTIVQEGDEGDSLFVVCSGTVEVVKRWCAAGEQTVRERRIAVLGVGDVFGEMELIDTQRRSATVRACGAVTAVALTNGGLLEIYQADPPTFTLIVLNLARELSRRLRAIDDLLVRNGACAPSGGQQ